MKKAVFTLIVSVLVSLPSWAGDADKNVRGVKLTGKEVKNNISDWGIFPKFQIGNKIIALGDNWTNYYCSELTDNELTKEELFVKMGEADNELGFVDQFVKRSDNSICVLNFAGNHMITLKDMVVIPNSKSLADMKNFSSWKRYDLSSFNQKFRLSLDQFCSLSDSTILLHGTPTDDYKHIFSIMDYKNQKITPLDFLPEDGVDVPDAVKHDIYTSYSKLYGNGKGRFLYKCGREKYSFIFTIGKDNKVNVVKYLYKVYPEYKARDEWNAMLLEPRCEEECVAVGGNNICMLLADSDPDGNIYGKMTMENYSPFVYGNVVELFDWDGNKKNILYLDHYGQRIFLSEDGKKLYLFSDNNGLTTPKEPYIWVYDISNLDNQPSVDIAEMEKAHEIKYKNDIENRSKIKPKDVGDFVKEGDMMADFELYDYDDKPHHLYEFLGKGKYTILEFSGIGCVPCQEAKPYLEKFYKQYKDKFEIITISTDRLFDWKKKPLGEVSWHEWNDHNMGKDIMRKYDVQGIPTFIIVSPEGKVERKCLAVGKFYEALKDYIPAEEVDKIFKK